MKIQIPYTVTFKDAGGGLQGFVQAPLVIEVDDDVPLSQALTDCTEELARQAFALSGVLVRVRGLQLEIGPGEDLSDLA